MSLLVLGVFFLFGRLSVKANHSWGGYHWARTSNPFTLKLGDNLSSGWDPYLSTTSGDWSLSSVLDTMIVSGSTTGRRCRATGGRVEVCNSSYGNNGWLGLAQIWVSGLHITKGTTKMNDTYFGLAKYNTPAWKRLVVCQEVAHTLGLDHQDEIFNNPNLGTCMDYTDNPAGPPSNEHPNAHDYAELEAIYSQTDGFTTVSQTISQLAQNLGRRIQDDIGEIKSEWGRAIKDNGNVGLFERDFGMGQKVFTFVIWASE
ncbi:MAG: hypothetical protein UX91_C0007G0013 [Candidatus Amesbacteria bacterium GW2011_GWB1_47_19]|nr:MAG: hypothetical protein UW51_C0006G0166 [Candidatus Amesbacteria bacterium GW2011_GWA1_44_24]KKU31797.1 MAG: hypothetical protein UX46_C0002G0013 [Candidatus Amesbacteria bacterium GW2011_GWC1_46_24]KKU66733.1 MAG: hypothetical protein UX91_C0007G0013 [Candidatus Amesbacteria bacterium GW2011_GWB1_47_19]